MARVLFIDDDHFTLETLTRAVQLLGHQAIVAGDGTQALRMALAEHPDVIFTDMQLPDTDGATLVCDMKKHQELTETPIYILSASPTVDAVDCAREAGAAAYINKPIRLQALLEILQKYTHG